MKRKILISAVAVAALVGGGTYTAVAASADDAAPTSKVTVSEAVDAALQKAPGTVESAGTDDDAGVWEVDVQGKNGDDREVTVDASGKASAAQDDKGDDDRSDDSGSDDAAERKALSAAKVDAEQASTAALEFRPGTVTEVEFDDGHWEVDVRGKDGASHDVTVDATTGKASAAQDDNAKDTDDADSKNDKDDKDDKANSASDDGTSKDKADDGSDD
ncbi:PepSY domain-containing protein [Streptomyces sp. NBC_00306]|uniref:PepSY domain-containing protein n=1 Tax=Streptomyces sp. NBC_00306 TaxID=2975708 RepID=UPI002E29FA02|nr:PepSY domain-containing protein [Streptomyces sp. NBC_00306]